MKKKEVNPYKNIKLGQKDQAIEYIVVGIAAAMIIFFFSKILFF